MISATATRVPEHTSPRVNERIQQRTLRDIREYHGRPDLVAARLRELDREWDIERTLQTNFAAVVLVSAALGAFVDRRWLLLGGAACAFMLEHAIQGWCPPLPVFRRLGVRTEREIDEERTALLDALDREPQAPLL